MYPNNGNYYGQPQQQSAWSNTNNNIDYPNIDNNAYVSPSPQGQGFSYQPFNQGFNNQPYDQGFQNQGFQNQGFQNQGFNNQGFNNQGFNNQGYNQGFNQGFNNYPVSSSKKTFQNLTIHDDFEMVQKMLTIGMDMKLIRNGSQFGFIKQKMLSIGRTFELQTNEGNTIAVAKQKIFTIGRDFQIFDQNNTKIGSIKEQVLKSMISIHRKYTVFDQNGVPVAYTKQLEFANKSGIDVYNTINNCPEAKFSQQWMSFIKEKWDIRFFGENVDRRLLVFFPSVSSQRQEQKSLSQNNY